MPFAEAKGQMEPELLRQGWTRLRLVSSGPPGFAGSKAFLEA
jgi:hypothetical protein